MEPVSFRKFSITSKIDDPFEKDGLRGNVFHIVRMPFGWITIAIFTLSVCLHIVHSQDIAKAARQRLESNAREGGAGATSPDPEPDAAGRAAAGPADEDAPPACPRECTV